MNVNINTNADDDDDVQILRMRDLIKTDKNLPGWMNWLGIALLVVLAISGAVFSYQDLASDAKPACCGSH